MSVFQSKINVRSDGFAKNRADMLALIDKLHTLNGRGAQISEQRKSRFAAVADQRPRSPRRICCSASSFKSKWV